MNKSKKILIVISIALLTSVTACKNIGSLTASFDSLNGHYRETEKRLSTYAQNAVKEGVTSEALTVYEKLYNRTIHQFGAPDTKIVLNYAQLLRKSGDAKAAVEVLSSFVENTNGTIQNNPEYILVNEFAAGLIELGNFKKADYFLNYILEENKAKEFHADAFNLRGILLSNQGKYKEAETSFRQALSDWKGNNSSVKNNLAVCLASQGIFDESLFNLRQALATSPDKEEIAYNIKLITGIRDSLIPKAETPINIKK